MPKTPLVSLFMCIYNQEKWIEQALLSVFNQDYQNLEIVISDDHSTDQTYELACQIVNTYNGSHRIILNQNETNLGLIRHYNKSEALCNGELIVLAHGDDICTPTKVSAFAHAYFSGKNKPLYLFSSLQCINMQGEKLKISIPEYTNSHHREMSYLSTRLPLVTGASSAYSKDIFKLFGPIHELNTYEDLVFSFRGILLNRITYIDSPLTLYRIGTGVTTSNIVIDKKNSRNNNLYVAQIIKDLQWKIASYEQRKRDASIVGNTEAIAALDKELLKLKTQRIAYTNTSHLFYAYGDLKNTVGLSFEVLIIFFKAWFRKKRKGWK